MKASRTRLHAQTQQLIHQPAPVVFSAFVEPAMLRRFWLAKASGPLAPGKKVHWEFKVRGAADEVEVTAWEENRQIRIRWSDGSFTDWKFDPVARNETLVTIEQSGFPKGTAIAAALEATQGYTIVLCDLKVLLEQGIKPRLVADKAIVIQREMAAAKRR